MQKPDWFPSEYLKGGSSEFKKVKINVGGQLFELSEVLLRREPGSLLHALIEEDSPLQNGEEGVMHVDRDWWTFRHVLKFLRDGVLPGDREVLTQLYKEASFWRMTNLKLAIEEDRLNLRRKNMKWDNDGDHVVEEDVVIDKWYKDLPNWWESSSGQKGRNNKNNGSGSPRGGSSSPRTKKYDSNGDEKPDDWWTGSSYNGKKYNPASSDKRKTTTYPESDDAVPSLSSTWSTSGSGRNRGYNSGYSGGGGGGGGVSSSYDSGLFGAYDGGNSCYPGMGGD
jgi:hypothetical protein